MSAREDFRKLLRARGKPATDGAVRPCVVVIDDDRSVREALRFELSSLYEVQLADSARQGVLAMSSAPAAVILDIKMRGEDGFFAYREIRKVDAAVPIIFNSAYQDAKDPFEIMNEYRPFGYLTKGDDLGLLLQQIARAVEYTARHAEKAELQEKLRRMTVEVERMRALTRGSNR